MGLLKGQVAKLPAENTRNDNFFQQLGLTWVYAVIWRGQAKKLTTEELKMPGNQAAEEASAIFLKNWQDEWELHKKGEKPSLIRALRRSFLREFIIAGVWKCVWSLFVILGAYYFVRSLVDYVKFTPDEMKVIGKEKKGDVNAYNSTGIENDGVGWILSAAFFIDSWLVGIALQRMGDTCVRLGIKVRAALMTSVFRKTFRLSNLHDEEGGNIVALCSSDCSKVYDGCYALHNVWTAPLETGAIIALLLSLTGVYGLPSIGVILIVLPLQYYFGYLTALYKTWNVGITDSRVERMHEILLAIKLVKFYVWEKSFAEQVAAIRTRELKLMFRQAVVKTFNLSLVFAVPPVIAIVIFSTYVTQNSTHKLDATTAFTVLSLFNTLRFPLVVLPKALRGTSEAVASIVRLERFLCLKETEMQERSKVTEVSFQNAELVHPVNPDEFTLKIKELSAKPGEVVAIVGRVGAGKSSIFQAILGNMKVKEGSMSVGGSIAYVPQSPWVQNMTLKDNILFGLPFDEQKYNKVIHACALELDLQILPKGDQTIAGERGINLSGGQRQRVCLARAVYHDCDMVLLDNPLSAVDQHTAKHIFDHCIKGMLADKAVIFITHQIDLLPQCDKISIMEDGGMTYYGAYDAGAMTSHMPVDHLLFATVEGGESVIKQADEEDEGKGTHELTRRKSIQRNSASQMKPVDSVSMAMGGVHTQESEEERKKAEVARLATVYEKACQQSPEDVAKQFNGTAERLTPGQAAFVYWGAGGFLFGIFSLCVFAGTQTLRVYSDYWIRQWATDKMQNWYLEVDNGVSDGGRFADPADANKLYILAYFAMVATFIILLLTRDTVFGLFAIRAATNLHNRLFLRILKAPFLFFLRTPVGDVLNAFAKDQTTIDETLVDTLHMSTIYLMILLTTLGIVASSFLYYLLVAFGLFFAFGMMQFLYLPAATVLKRWSGDTASQVFVQVDESLHGMDVIRAFGCVDFFVQDNIQRINTHHLAFFNTEQAHIWLAFWCDLMGALMVLITCLLAVNLRRQAVGKSAMTEVAASAGLAVSNSIQLLVFFTWVVRGCADVVSMWDAVERITTYATQVPDEKDVSTAVVAKKSHDEATKKIEESKVKAIQEDEDGASPAAVQVQIDKGGHGDLGSWPLRGDIRFEDVCLRYFPGAPLALRGVTFHIMDKEKIGVVGRTGSGKTTMLLALFRMFELAAGRIVVDGLDISKLDLQEVRSRLAIIPQEPVMFKGSVRSNLDPFGIATDAQLWEALELVHLKASISAMPGGLEAKVEEGGSNFSLGQKQLVCMGRCVLKPTRILVLDEATAAMDLQTDALIQKTIRKVFKERTTVTIAHRLDTIIFSDRVLAMHAGQMREFDAPNDLLKNPKSMFNLLVEDTGPHASATLRNMAAMGPQDVE